MNYILDYDILNEKLSKMINLNRCSYAKTRLGYEIPYYTYGSGDNHVVIVGGTHGSEIISVDFVLRLMDQISNKKGIFKSFDESKYTIHFIPVQNPEGFIVSTSAIRTLIPKNMLIDECEKICKDYYENYRQDDINVKNNPNDRSLKLHQKMFINSSYECISDKHIKLKESIKNILSDSRIPKGSMICYRSNGSGIELNRNTRFNQGIKDIKNNKTVYGLNRYNNIPTTIPSPIGIPCIDVNNFEYELENKFLYKLLDKLFNDKKLKCCFLFHGTGGEIYYKPIFESYENNLDDIEKEKIEKINLDIALKYQEYTGYRLTDNKDEKFESFDGYMRTLYPGIILIELSKMGGNPLGPYGDIEKNYIPTIESNLKAVESILEYLPNKV